jgi:hypothetical protein
VWSQRITSAVFWIAEWPSATAREHGRRCTSRAFLYPSLSFAYGALPPSSTLAAATPPSACPPVALPVVTLPLPLPPPPARLAPSSHSYLRSRRASRVHSADHDDSCAGQSVDDCTRYPARDRTCVAHRTPPRCTIVERRRDEHAPTSCRRTGTFHHHCRNRVTSYCTRSARNGWYHHFVRDHTTGRSLLGSKPRS